MTGNPSIQTDKNGWTVEVVDGIGFLPYIWIGNEDGTHVDSITRAGMLRLAREIADVSGYRLVRPDESINADG